MSGLSYALFIFSFKYAAPKASPQAILSIALGVITVILIVPGDIQQGLSVLASADLTLFITLGLILLTVTTLSIYSNTKHPGYIVWKPWRALKALVSNERFAR